MKLTSLLLVAIILISCDLVVTAPDENVVLSAKTKRTVIDNDSLHTAPDLHPSFPYFLNDPDYEFVLPAKLEEISGLALEENGQQLYAVQDEKGNVYKINIKTGEVEDKVDFAPNGDYEGIAINGTTTYVTKSNGTIYEVANIGTDHQAVDKFQTPLKGKNDIEGLCFYPAQNSLLIACKGIPNFGETAETSNDRKFIYRFDLTTKKMVEEPFYKITLKTIKAFIEQNGENDSLEKFKEELEETNRLRFSPSGIAVHPQTGDLYILSSKKRMILVLNANLDIQHLIKLKKSMHRQPEGIAFGKNGTLYVSNEGKGGSGKIFGFVPTTMMGAR